MQPNLIDRAIGALSPAWGIERMKARAQMGIMSTFTASLDDGADMPSASPSVSGGGGRRWWPMARDAKSDTLKGLTSERAKSRLLARSSPIAVGAINTNIDRVVGTGLALSAQPNRAVLGWSPEQTTEWKRKTQAEFSLWADSTACDLAEKLCFYDIQALVLRATLESGDCFTNLPASPRTRAMPYGLRLQVLEADMVGNPMGQQDDDKITAGIKLGPGGQSLAYHVYAQHPGAGYSANSALHKGEWVERMGSSGRLRILHHYRQLRPGQPRGIPYLAPIVDAIKQIARYSDAEITAAVISAYFTVFIESPSGNPAPVFAGADPAAEGGGASEIGLAPAAVVGLAPGEKATFANPNRPNTAFEPFTLAVIRQMGMALGIPYELLIKQFNASYSASKAALLDAWVYFRSVRTFLARSFCQPVYETWLAEAVALGRIEAPGFFADPLMRWAYTRAAWQGDSMGSINPKDEIAAYTAAIDARLMTRERAEWELFGSDFAETFDQKRSEQDLLNSADMLPVPKAGAAAPAGPTSPPAPSNPSTPNQGS